MRRALAFICAFVAPYVLSAQKNVTAWANLSTLHNGEKVAVVSANHAAVSGAFESFSDDSLIVRDRSGSQTILKQDVRSVKRLHNPHVGRNIAIGVAVGAGGGAGISAAAWEHNGYLGAKGAGAEAGAVIGGVAGAVVAALVRSHPIIYHSATQ